MDSAREPIKVEFDEMSEVPPAIAFEPEFHDILAGFIALADANKIEMVPTERTRAKWAKTKKKIEELQGKSKSMPQPK